MAVSWHMLEEKTCETIILGGGISGLSCARQLYARGKEFLLLTENVGGRICPSPDGKAHYGAYYIARPISSYRKFVTLGKRLAVSKTTLYGPNLAERYTASPMDLLRNLGAILRFSGLLLLFAGKYRFLLARCKKMQQADALQSDNFLWKLYFQTAEEFVKKYRLEKLGDRYLRHILWGQAFSNLKEINAFTFLQLSLPLLVPIYEFNFEKEKMTEPFTERILHETIEIAYERDGMYVVQTISGKSFRSKNLVLATPIWVTRKIAKDILPLPDMKEGASTHVFHLSGKMHDAFPKSTFGIFSPGDELHSIIQLTGDTYLIYARVEKPDFGRIFSTWDIIGGKSWNPALCIRGTVLLENRPRANLYLIGDHNFCGTEASYVSGLYAGTSP